MIKAVVETAKSMEGVNTRDTNRFRVITVGGFSEFYPLRVLLGEVFNTECDGAAVFDTLLVGDDKWLAVSMGACLVAANKIELEETVPFTFGVITYDQNGNPNYRPLMEAGRQLTHYKDPVFAPLTFSTQRNSNDGNTLERGGTGSISFYHEIAGNKTPLPMKKSFEDTLPDHRNATWWRLGCVLESGGIVILIESDTGKIKSVRTPRLMAMIDRKNLSEHDS